MKQITENLIASLLALVVIAAVTMLSEYVSPDPSIRKTMLVVTAVVFCVIFLRSILREYLQISAENSRHRWAVMGAHQALSRDELIERAALPLLNILHLARDASVRHMPVPEGPYTPPPPMSDGRFPPDPRLEENRDLIINMLNDLVGVFREIAPSGTKVWASLRDRRADGNYHTFERAGAYTLGRKASSRPLNKERSRTVFELRQSYQTGSCVIRTGSNMGESKWEPNPNDRFNENLCVLMGAVMTKSPADGLKGTEWKNAKLTWILSINADRPDAFNDNHREIMRCAVVAFSWLANTLMRKELLAAASTRLPMRPDRDGGSPSGEGGSPAREGSIALGERS